LSFSQKLNFINRFIDLGPEFYQEKLPDRVTDPYLVDYSPLVGQLIDLPSEIGPEFLKAFSGNQSMAGARPLAMNYSGHQFGSYNPRLGDGRGLLLGEVFNKDKISWDVYLKGAGPTRFARGFDGRATLKSSIREHLGSEALNGLGVPSTRSLAVIGIRELIYREKPELAAILVRIADCHIRFGSFEFFHYTNQPKNIKRLADFSIQNFHNDIWSEPDRYRVFFKRVLILTAKLIAKWQAVGFIHGVMNTDNMTITGTTFDYGPYGFMDSFNPRYTPNLSDTQSRYAYQKQPEIGFWNLNKFAETLVALVGADQLQEEIKQYQSIFNDFYRKEMGAKLGLSILDSDFNQLTQEMFLLLQKHRLDYSNFFRQLADYPDKLGKTQFVEGFHSWLEKYTKLCDREGINNDDRKRKMDAINPKFILRTHLVHQALNRALKESDFSEIKRLRVLLENPFDDRPEIFNEYNIDPNFYSQDTPNEFLGNQLSCSA